MKPNNILIDEYKKWYSTEVAIQPDNFEKFIFHLKNQLHNLPVSGKRVLEVGCGKGAVSLYLALFSNVEQIIALDEAAGEGAPVGVNQSLRAAIKKFDISNIEVIDKDIMENKYPNRYFSTIIANNSLHHVIDSGLISKNEETRNGYVNLFRELKRILSDDGTLSITEYSRNSIWRWLPFELRWKNIDWNIHPTLNEWLSVMRDAGFEISSFYYSVPYSFRKVKPLFANAIVQFFFYPCFVITAKKHL